MAPERWGTTVHGTGDIDVAAKAIEEASGSAGMTCRRETPSQGLVEITAVQKARWYKVVLRGLAQRAAWRLSQDGDRLEISGDFYGFLWYRLVLSALGFLTVCGIVVAFAIDPSGFPPDQESLILKIMPLVSLIPFLATAYLLLGGAHHREEIWQTLLRRIDERGGNLELRGIGLGLRNILIYAVLLTLCSPFVVRTVTDFYGGGRDHGQALTTGAALLILGILVLFLVATIGLMLRWEGFRHRVDAVVTGLVTICSALFFLSPVLMWLVIGDPYRISSEDLERISSSRVSIWMCLIVFTSPIVGSLSLFALLGVRRSIYLERSLTRLKGERRAGKLRSAVEGKPFLRYFRAILVATWTLLAAGILCILVALVLCAVQAVDLSFPYPRAGLVDLSSSIVGIAFGDLIDVEILNAATRGTWLLYALTALAVYFTSVGQLYWKRRSSRQRFRALLLSSESENGQVRQIFATLLRLAEEEDVELLITPEEHPEVFARCFFTFHGEERLVAISRGILVDYEAPELQALLSHELVHLLEGHCRTHSFMRWLGRLTFVGDGFVMALQDSFDYEKKADRLALERSWTSPKALEGALLMMRNTMPGWQGENPLGFGPRGSSPDSTAPDRSWRLAWRCFRQQYFAAQELHYWHPAYEERLEDVRSRIRDSH